MNLRTSLMLFILQLCLSCTIKSNKEPIDIKTKSDSSIILDESQVNYSSDSTDETSIQHHTEIISKHISKKSDCKKCNIENVVAVEKTISKMDYQTIYDFLCILDSSCKPKVEFVEFSNRMIFELLNLYPVDIVEILSLHPDLQTDYLFKEISSPILDYDIKSIYKAVEDTNGNEKVKNQILKALKTSINK